MGIMLSIRRAFTRTFPDGGKYPRESSRMRLLICTQKARPARNLKSIWSARDNAQAARTSRGAGTPRAARAAGRPIHNHTRTHTVGGHEHLSIMTPMVPIITGVLLGPLGHLIRRRGDRTHLANNH